MLLFYDQNAVSKTVVTLIHNQPNLLAEEVRTQGYEVETLPQAETIDGKTAILYIDPTTKELSYQYTNVVLSTEEENKKRITQLETELATTNDQLTITQSALDALLLG